MLKNLRQLAAKIESVEGTAESLAAADAKIIAINQMVSHAPDMFSRSPSLLSWSKRGDVVGKRPAGITFGIAMRGSGVATTEPEWSKILRAAGFQINSLYSITIGAVTNGPFQHGETITGGTSDATGKVIIDTATGTTTLYFEKTSSATFSSGEVITGAASGATATTGSVPSAAGQAWRPLSGETHPSLTIGAYEHQIRKLLKGCRGSVKFNLKVGEPGIMNFDFKGVDQGVIDTDLLTGISLEQTKPPAFLNASLVIGAYAAKLSEIEINMAGVLGMREDASEQKGILSFRITDRAPEGTINPEMVQVATNDFYGQWMAGTEAALDFILGSVSGNKFRFYAPKIQYKNIEDDERDGIKIAKCTFGLNLSQEAGDDELAILAL